MFPQLDTKLKKETQTQSMLCILLEKGNLLNIQLISNGTDRKLEY